MSKHKRIETSPDAKADGVDDCLWLPQNAEVDLIWELGNPYPIAASCMMYEINVLGEKRLVEGKVLKIAQSSELQSC